VPVGGKSAHASHSHTFKNKIAAFRSDYSHPLDRLADLRLAKNP